MKTQKRHLIILMMFVIGLLQANTIVWAQSQPVIEYWSELEPVGPRTISTPTNVYLTGNVTLNGTITVEKGVALNIYAEGANRTIYRNFDGDMFVTEAGADSKEGGILRFNADKRTQTITIDGGAQFQDDDAKKDLLNSPNDGRTIVARGSLIMHHVIIQNIYHNDDAGAIAFDSQGSKPNGDGYNMAVSDLIIRAVKAATVIYFESRDHHQFGDDDFVGVEIYNCSSLGSSSNKWGGTIRAVGGVKSNLVLNACSIHDNIAKYGGAVFWNAGNGTSCKLRIIGDTKIYNNEAIETGGGISSLSTVDLQSAEIYNNRAKKGGGLCVDTYYGGNDNYSGKGFEVNIVDEVSIHDNTADEAGGGIYMLFQPTNDVGFDAAGNPFSPQFKFEMTGGSIYNNHAPIGAGVAIVDMAPNKHRNNKSGDPACGRWSGEYVRNVSISGGSIYGNSPVSGSTDTKGAGMYIAKVKAANIADGSIGYRYGDAITGGGVVTAGSITINPTGGNIYGNQANNGSGGGMYIVDEMKYVSPYFSVCNVNVGAVNNVEAVNIYGNTCSGNGGGLYVESGIISLNGANVSGNSTNSGNGGGIYFDANSTMTVGTGNLKVKDNTANGVPNNIYLPTGKTIGIVLDDFNPQYLGIYTQATATAGSPIPVFTVANSSNYTYLDRIYTGMTNGTMNVVDDRQIHSAQYTSPQTTLYFGIGSPWSPLQQTIENDSDLPTPVQGVYPIGSVKDLTAFLWYVNHVTDHNEHQFDNAPHPEASAILTADIDMTGHYWVPFANYEGTFDGNGHTITGIMMVPTNASTYTGRGLFGTTETGAVIKNVALDDCQFFAKALDECYVGSIVSDLAAGTVSNSVANPGVKLSASGNASAVLGGIAGRVSGGTLHSSIATAEMTGYQMGGLVGQLSGGNLYNSFANAKFANGGSGCVGGLVGVNAGTVENCYAREQAGSSHGSDFGYLVGDNTSGTIQYGYAPSATYTASGKTGNQTGLGTFTATTANAYDYKAHDNQVSATNNSHVPTIANKQLVKTLNNWVEQDAVHKATYARWLRPTTQAINGDYPLLRLPAFNAVAATDGDAALDYGDINEHLTSYKAANQAICLYGSRENVNTNIGIGTNAPLYIDQDAVITQTGDIQAYVGVTLDNSAGNNGANPSFGGSDAIDWHFFSSVLKNSPIGLHYGDPGSATEDTDPYQAYVYPSWNATFTNANGYFPINLNNYYDEWDLYAYCEPDYHWINLKRNSASHWHEDYPGINIPYTNDTEFVPGKGYMVALKEEGYLQAYGTLNTNTGVGSDSLSVPVTCTSSIGWTTREGHNLLGNPYQSYLDFDAFVRKNASLWNEGRKPFYIIMDEYNKGYVLYTVGQSSNAEQASRFLHPHQGFMIDSDVKGWARFDNGMRTTSTTTTGDNPVTWEGYFRGEETPCYPLVNLMATDANGNRDIVTVELGRPDKGGALKQDAMHSGKGSLWCRYEDEDYALVFTQPGLEYANIRFAADEDAEFTMTWSTHNGEFSYLHLIDNMTGADIDCLSTSEYKFSARESDYNSRFRLVFDYTGIDDHEVPEPVEGPATFAYYANGEIHLTDSQADASLQIIDMTGRTIVSRDGVHTVSTTGLAAGVYVLRLTDGNGTRTQKIILN